MNLKQKQFLDSYVGIPLVYIHLLAARILGFILRRDHSLKAKPKEICIIKLLGYGSVIMASDAIASVKKKYPDAVLSIICSSSIQQGIQSLQLFEKVYVIDDSNFFSVLFSSLKIIWQLIRKKRLWTIDLEVYSKLTSILSLWTMASNRFGYYFNQVSFRERLNTHNVYFNNLINVTENYHQMAIATGVEVFAKYTFPGYPPREKGKQFNYIAINNTCSEFSQERKMSSKQLSDLCNWILRNTGYKIALLGAPSDREQNLNFIAELNLPEGSIKNTAGEMSLEHYYSFLYNECYFIITIDSAPLHIANKLNLPNISIWGPTTPESRINLESQNIALYQQVSCSPCAHFIDNLPCGGNNFCIKNIPLESTINAIQTLLKSINEN